MVLAVFVFIVWKEGMPDWREEKRVAPSLQAAAGAGVHQRGFLSSVCLFFFFKWGLGFCLFLFKWGRGWWGGSQYSLQLILK